MRRKHSREPQLFDLTNFVEDEMTLASDPLYSRDAVSQYFEKNQKFIKPKRFTVNTVKAEELGKVDISKKLKIGNRCPVCCESDNIEDCVFFLQQTLEEQSQLLYKRKLCYGCFEEVTKKHNAKSCANRRICKVCNGEYPTKLHGYARKKKQNDNQKDDGADAPNGVDVKCAIVNTGGNVVSMCVVPVNLTYSCFGKIVKTHALLDSCSQGTFMLEKLL